MNQTSAICDIAIFVMKAKYRLHLLESLGNICKAGNYDTLGSFGPKRLGSEGIIIFKLL